MTADQPASGQRISGQRISGQQILGQRIAVLIPAYNEQDAIGKVIAAVPSCAGHILVADNNSTDATAQTARAAGATVVPAKQQGYGSACLAGIAALAKDPPDILVFLDADFADDPAFLLPLTEPVCNGECDFVIGSRRALAERGSLTRAQIFGNALACFLIKRIWRTDFSDLGPFRAIRWTTLESLNMADPDFGWTVEMQIKAAKLGVRTKEIDVPYRNRIGTSKISGTVKGTVLAGTKILYLIFKNLFSGRR